MLMHTRHTEHTGLSRRRASPSLAASLVSLGAGATAAAAQTDAGRAGAGSMIDAPGSPRDARAIAAEPGCRIRAGKEGKGRLGRPRRLQDCAAQRAE